MCSSSHCLVRIHMTVGTLWAKYKLVQHSLYRTPDSTDQLEPLGQYKMHIKMKEPK